MNARPMLTSVIWRSVVGPLLVSMALALAACRGDARREQDSSAAWKSPNLLDIDGATIEVTLPDGSMHLPQDALRLWVAECAHAVQTYYGRFPVDRTTIELLRTEDRGVSGGTTFGRDDSVLIRIHVGALTEAAELANDWELTHEMVHTALSQLPRAHHWLEEGLATYVEPIARAQAGLESAADVWKQLIAGLPQGLPAVGDQGLDRTHTWGRTYWGGALFCLLADIEIRERTQNRAGLQDALRAIVAKGLNIETVSPIERVLAVGDEAVGVPVLSELYARHATHAEQVDLAALWKRLGISLSRGRIRFDDSAPLADVRRAITKAEK